MIWVESKHSAIELRTEEATSFIPCSFVRTNPPIVLVVLKQHCCTGQSYSN